MSTSPDITRPQLAHPVTAVRIDPEKPFSVHVVTVGRSPRVSQPTRGKRNSFFLNSEAIVHTVIQAWQPIGCKVTFICDRAALDAIDEYYKQQWRQAFLRTKTIFERMQADGIHIDENRVRGMLVEHLSPLDRGHLNFVQNLNMTLKEALSIENELWATLVNTAKTLHTPHMPIALQVRIEKHASRATREIQRNLECCNKADQVVKKQARPFLRRKHNAGVRKLAETLTALLMTSRLTRSEAAESTYELIRAWAPDVTVSSAESLRVRSIQRKKLL
jgi:hypothetical protein